MTQPTHPRRDRGGAMLRLARALTDDGIPVLPLRADKLPMGNCPDCHEKQCGGRPNMKTPGPCTCPAPCHAWAAATTDPDVLTSPAWAPSWSEARAVAYHPGAAHLTVVDLDDQAAVHWARTTLPPTLTVVSTRGEHWLYAGAMTSANRVRPGVDIKSRMSYTRWLGHGTGTLAPLPAAVRALVVREEATPAPVGGPVASSSPAPATWDRTTSGCRHTAAYLRTGLDRGLAKVRARSEAGAGSQVFGVAKFLAAQHTLCPGPCGLAALHQHLTAAATAVGVPEAYAARAVTNGINTGLGRTS